MKNFLAHNMRWLVPIGLAGTALVAYLAFAVFGIHTLFIDNKVNESGPVFASGASASEPVTTTSAVPTTAAGAAAPSPTTTLTSPASTGPAPGVVVERSGAFSGRAHHTTGIAEVLGDGSGQRFLRFEEFETSNGPDLRVYLSAAPVDAIDGEFDDDFVDLGVLKGNIGPQNYEIPPDADLDIYDTVVIWCVRFRVPFGVAELSPS